MSMLSPLLATNPSSPRLTVYDEAAGTRMDFSALTLDNWASKVANMFDAEFELDADALVLIDVPPSWQAAVIALGAYNSGRTPVFGVDTPGEPDVVFTTVEGAAKWVSVPDVVVVSDDPFGRGVVESGGTLPLGAIDFGPTVRFYGDDYAGASPALSTWARPDLEPARYSIAAWETSEDFERRVLGPLAADGSVVLVTGLASVERLDDIAETENVTHSLTTD
ncbi:TIGR03089 family protein [Corynebacterium sp.]|uniref:TIGR03089 family protein n=1 Tax=Corynebacterium sp. TaxID=1720 RepID=UPI002A91AA61|nr:TIGR03089 family protein [Corynebacterium sp.]MDY5786328.1 TIGR03089 family protein [Corynebacterium sp.]